jgi:hypothetical protein
MAQKAAKIESGMLGFHQSSFVVVPGSRFSRTSIWGQVKYQGSRRPNQLSTQSPFFPIKVAKHLTCPQEVNRPGLLGSRRGKAGTLYVHQAHHAPSSFPVPLKPENENEGR